jgi:predicted GTPase
MKEIIKQVTDILCSVARETPWNLENFVEPIIEALRNGHTF